MAEVMTQAESSPVEEKDPFNGLQPSVHEFNTYRVTGEVPERFKPEAESAPAAEGDEPEIATESAPENDEEPPEGIGNKARRRFEKLLAQKKELERKLAEKAKPDAEIPAPSAAPTQITPTTRPEPKAGDKNPDGTDKYADYAEFIKDLGKWSAEQTLFESHQRQLQQQNIERVNRDRERYGDEFDKVLAPTAQRINENKNIPLAVKMALADSDVMAEVVYAIGSDQETIKKLERLAVENPARAIKYIGALESAVRQEMDAEDEPEVEEVPTPKKTNAPKPPSPVSGGSSRAFDVSDESLSAEDWARKRNAHLARRRAS